MLPFAAAMPLLEELRTRGVRARIAIR